MTRNHIGVDLSCQWLDICDPRRGEARIANAAEQVARYLRTLSAEDLLVIEATSRADGTIRAEAATAGVPIVRLNPVRTPGTSPGR